MPKRGRYQWNGGEDPQCAEGRKPSRSEMKRRSHALQALGAGLARLPPARLAQLRLPQDLETALEELGRLTSREARRRQIQYVGRLMRGIDPALLQAVLAAMDAPIGKNQEKRLQTLDGKSVLE